MIYEQQTPPINDLIDSIIETSAQSWNLISGDEKEQMRDLLTATTNSVLGWRQRPLEYHRDSVISDVTGLAYRLATGLYEESYWEQCEKLAFLSYQLATSVDWRERALGALKLALLAGSSLPRWDDLDRLRSRVRQRVRRLLGVQASFDRLPNGIDLNRLTDDVVWRIWDRHWQSQVDDDGRRQMLRKNIRFGWNYTFAHPNHPAKQAFRQNARDFLAGEVATRIATGEVEAEWIDLFEPEVSAVIADWTLNVPDDTVFNTIGEVSDQLQSRLINSLERWLEWWRPLKTLREGDREAIEMFRDAQQSLFDEDSLGKSVDMFRATFDLAPGDLGVKEWYAYSLILTGDYSSAERLLQQIITARRQDFATITNLAGIYVRTKRLQEASDLLCSQELFDRNLHRRPYVGAVLGLLLQLEQYDIIPQRIAQLETIEWLPVGVMLAFRHSDEDTRQYLLRKLIDNAAIAIGRKGSDLSDPNDALVPIARLEKDFAYFQTEGLLELGIEHFKTRTERYPWFWANWHYLGKLHEMSGNIVDAKDAFLRKAEATSNSKAPRKSKLDNWHYYLEFCFRNQLYDSLKPGIDGAQNSGMPEAKLLRYRRAMLAFEPNSAPLQELTTERIDSIENEGEEFISPNASTGLIGFEFSEPYPTHTTWNVYPSSDWSGELTVLPHNRQDALRRELAVRWMSHDGTLPSSVILRSQDGIIEQSVKLYRTDRSYTPRDHLSGVNLLELYPEIQNRLRRHLATNLPGEVIALEAPNGFGVAQIAGQIAAEGEHVNCQVHIVSAPDGNFEEERIVKWTTQILTKCYPTFTMNGSSIADLTKSIDSLRSTINARAKQAIVLSNFADGWVISTADQSKQLANFLDVLQKLIELPDLIWIVCTGDLFHLRRHLQHTFWRSLQILRVSVLNDDQMISLMNYWFEDRSGISEQAVQTLQTLCGGVYELFVALLQEAIKDVNNVQQQRILASNLITAGNWVASSTILFRRWADLQMPSQQPARTILDSISQGSRILDNDPDLMYLREIGLVSGKNNEIRVVTPLYQPKLAYGANLLGTTAEDRNKSTTVILIDHENLFLGLKDEALRAGRTWNDRDGIRVGGIADQILNWVRKDHRILFYPIAIANWDAEPFISHMRPYQQAGFYTLLPEGTKENSADFMIYLESSRLLREYPNVETVILVTGDGDFAMLVRSLKTQGKRVRVLAVNGSASLALRAAVGSDFQFIEPIIG